MSTDFAPLFKTAAGGYQRFGAEETLTWNFTSGTGNPMELVISGSTYFTFDRNGALALESNITWNTDAGGDVGGQYDYRPDYVNAATAVRVGAVAGGSDYGSMLTLNRLTLGHADVDKYIDADQASGGTPPFMRYNAVNTRWEYSNDGTTVIAFDAGFSANTWDAIYAVDQKLIIDNVPLEWSQTSTSEVGFAVYRNLTSTSTDTGVMLVEQQHASDDQPPLVLAQNAASVSALSIYEGLYGLDGAGGGTERFSFIPEGQLSITTSATLAAAAIAIDQTDDDEAFLSATGTSAADASKNVSTANSGTADMIRVEVDGGGGAATRWVPAYNSVTLPGTTTWDGIYLLDQKLDINGATLQFDQTSTGPTYTRGFEVTRNVGATTIAPLMVVEQQHAADTYPPLTVGQNNSAADVLQLYDGSVASGTMRFQFEPLGRLNIIGSASLTTEAFRIELNNATTPFVEVKGTAAAGTGNNISTDSTPPVEMLQIAVDSGSGAAKRWLPAYVSPTIASTYDWDLIYAADKKLDINAAILQWEQDSTSAALGSAFRVYRDVALATTVSAIMQVEQVNDGDDQAALQVIGGIGDVTASVPALQLTSVSTGMATGATNVMQGAAATLTKHASDASGAELHGFYAESPSAVGSGEAHGFHAANDLDYGLYSLSRSEIDVTDATYAALKLVQRSTGWIQQWATASTTRMYLTAGGGLDIASSSTAAVPTIQILQNDLDKNGIDVDSASTNTAYGIDIDNQWARGISNLSPTYLAAPADTTGLDLVGTYTAGHGSLVSFSTIGYTSPTLQSTDSVVLSAISAAQNAGDDVLSSTTGLSITSTVAGAGVSKGLVISANWATGILCSSPSSFQSTIAAAADVTLSDDVGLVFGDGPDARIEWDTGQATANTLLWGMGASNSLVICEYGDMGTDFGHTAASEPTVFVHSADATHLGEYVGISYNGILAGTRVADLDGFDFTVKGSNALSGAANNDGGNLVLEGGDKFTGGVDGIVQVGSGFSTSHSLDAASDLGVAGDLEVDGEAHFDNLTYLYGTTILSQYLMFGGQTSSDTAFGSDTIFDQMVLTVGSNHGRQLVVGDRGSLTKDFDHATTTHPTLFIHSVLDPDTDNGEFVQLAYTGLQCGTMETDRAVYDFTIKGSNAFPTGGLNDDGGNIILEGGDRFTGGVDGIVQVGSTFTSTHSLVDNDDLGIAGKLEADGPAFFDTSIALTPPNPTDDFDAHTITMASGGLPNKTMRSLVISMTSHASDSPGYATGIDLAFSNIGGTPIATGLNIDANWSLGIKSLSPSYFGASIQLLDDIELSLGSSFDAKIRWDSGQDEEALMVGVGASRSLILCDTADVDHNFVHAIASDPTLFVHSANTLDDGWFVGLSYTGLVCGTMTTDRAAADFTIKGTTASSVSTGVNQNGGEVILEGGDKYDAGTDGIVRIGTTGTPTYAAAKNDLYVGGTFEVAGVSRIQGQLVMGSSWIRPFTNAGIIFNGTAGSQLTWNTGSTVPTMEWALDNSSRNIVFCEYADSGTNWSHAQQTNPTIFVHSANASTTEWFGLLHNQTDAELTSGAGKIKLSPATGVEIVSAVNSTGLALTPGQPTATTDFVDITATSGGLNGATASMTALDINLTGSASDTGGAAGSPTAIGIDLDYTAGAGTDYTVGAKFRPGWDRVLEIDSDPAASQPAVAICNDATNASISLYIGDGTIAEIGGTNVNRFIFWEDGHCDWVIDDSANGLSVSQAYSSAGSTIVQFNDSNASKTRLSVQQEGETDIEVNSSTSGLRVGQAGSGPILELADGVPGGTERFSVTEAGYTKITTKTDVGTEALQISQNDADKAFIDFAGSSGDPSTNNTTTTNGNGNVVGPKDQSTTEPYWSFNGMVKVEVGGSEHWMPYYDYHAS